MTLKGMSCAGIARRPARLDVQLLPALVEVVVLAGIGRDRGAPHVGACCCCSPGDADVGAWRATVGAGVVRRALDPRRQQDPWRNQRNQS